MSDPNNEQHYEIRDDLHKDPTTNALLNIAKAINNVAEAIAGSGNCKGLVDCISPIATQSINGILEHGMEELCVALGRVADSLPSE